jgi:hypothetical protein
MISPDTNDLLNLPTCAARLGLPIRWLKAHAQAGDVPCLKVTNRLFLFDPLAVRQALIRMAAEPSQSTVRRHSTMETMITPFKQGAA